jgi:hypothetical protein
MEVDDDVEMKDTFEGREQDLPQAIPTITTRVNFTPIRAPPVSREKPGTERSTSTPVGEPLEKVESVSSDSFDEPTPSEGSQPQIHTVSPDKATVLTIETEDISDGEISSAEEEILTAPGNT